MSIARRGPVPPVSEESANERQTFSRHHGLAGRGVPQVMQPTELEQQLTTALTALAKQYEADMEHQAEGVGELQEQVQRLEEAVKDLKP